MRNQHEIEIRLAQLDAELAMLRDEALSIASSILSRDVSLSSFHGIIGSKNRDFGNIEQREFASVAEFQAEWAEKMAAFYEPYKDKWAKDSDLPSIIRLYKNEKIRQYILLFQERNYYRKYEQRVRKKPSEQLYELWFGDKIVFGLYVALSYSEDGTFKFKPSDVRKVSYNYWTIGNILGVGGFVNGETGMLYPITSIEDLLVFYEHIIYCSSSSIYEKAIYTRYIDYLKTSHNVLEEPFLIPELHYEGRGIRCKYRLDFAICNPYTFEFVGFELSPSSTHVAVSHTRDKTQQQINAEFAMNWEKECEKRNSYFRQFGITTITFTDTHLKDMDACFEQVRSYLQRRKQEPKPIEETIQKISSLF